jgi:hypothetical protein
MFSCAPESIETLSAYRDHAYHINHSFAPDVLTRININTGLGHDVVFTGEIRLESEHHIKRLSILQALIKQCKLEIYSSNVVNGTKRLSLIKRIIISSSITHIDI